MTLQKLAAWCGLMLTIDLAIGLTAGWRYVAALYFVSVLGAVIIFAADELTYGR